MPFGGGGGGLQVNGGGEYVPPDYTPPPAPYTGGGVEAGIGDMPGDVTPWRSVNFAARANGITDFNGTYTVVTVTEHEIVLDDPELVNPSWTALGTDETVYFSPSLATTGMGWIGPFVIDMTDTEEVIANFYCPQGLYRINEEGEPRTQTVEGLLEVTPVDAAGSTTGAAETFAVSMTNKPESEGGKVLDVLTNDGTIDKSPRGKTLRAVLTTSAASRVRVRFRRTTPLPEYKDDQFVDELSIRDCYGIAPVTADNFGDVTTVHTRVQATSGATAPKERKLQAYVTRKVLERNVDDTLGPGLAPSQDAADIICHMAMDPHIGNRVLSEIDVAGIHDAVDTVKAYFGFEEAGEFNYSFDDDNFSFEEMVQTVAQAVFCTAYRQGSALKMFFEQATLDSTLLFNHRNKLPGSETRTVRFGVVDDQDGVEFDYQDADGQKQTLFLPADQTAVKPKKIERAGVTDTRVAQLHAWRIWNRMRYQHTTTEFDATAEASQLVLNERIEVADNTRPDVFDGHLVSQDGLVLELSQPFIPEEGVDYSIFIQLPGGGLDVIPVLPYMVETLGPELIINGDASGGTIAPWTNQYATGVPPGTTTIDAGRFKVTNDASAGMNYIFQSPVGTLGHRYRFKAEIETNRGNAAAIALVSADYSKYYLNRSTYGDPILGTTLSVDMAFLHDGAHPQFTAIIGLSQTFNMADIAWIDNVSLREIISEVSDPMRCILQAPTSVVLNFDPDKWADIVYQIVGDNAARSSAFLVAEKGAFDKRSVKVQAINYDPRYYQNDQDFA